MNKQHLYITLLLVTILLPVCKVLAQTKPIGKEVEVTRPYDPDVVEAQKIWYDPTVNPDSIKAKDLSYSVMPKSIASDFTISPIASANLIEMNRNEPRFGYVRAGVGYKPSTLLDFYVSNNNAKTVVLGLYANHRGFWGDVTLENELAEKDVAANNMSNNVGIFVRKPFSAATFSVNADYSGKRFLRYGYDPSWFNTPYNGVYSKDSVLQTNNLFNVNLQIESTPGSNEVEYMATTSFQYFYDHYDMQETAISLAGMLGKQLTDEHKLAVYIGATGYNRNTLLDTTGGNFLFNVNPYYMYASGDFSARLGLLFVGDQYGDGESKSYAYPAISASYRITDFLVPTVELRGETEVNSYRKLAEECMYITPGLANFGSVHSTQKFRNTYHRIMGIFSLKGDVGTSLSYNLYGSFSKIENLVLFVNQPVWASPLRFTNNIEVAYDNGWKYTVGGEIRFDMKPVSVYARAAYNSYSLDTYKKALHRPGFEANLTASYKYDSWVFSATFDMALDRYYMWQDPLSSSMMVTSYHKLDNIYNLGVGAEYLFNKNFSVFANLQNLLNKRYDTFYQYSVPGTMLYGGITYRF